MVAFPQMNKMVLKPCSQVVFISLNLFANISVRNVNTNIEDDRKFDGLGDYTVAFGKIAYFYLRSYDITRKLKH